VEYLENAVVVVVITGTREQNSTGIGFL